eukprot:TRINITY_DN397_c1_g1_i2.p2 TRINITY_DN397_c1_g1~~TRINITY_DN397_c1_g1_i2.p2  ORF type:complete len:240 (+),score=16.67 TRINITY_DN397_c1_g1_i2:517-1236(+)
MRCPYCGGNLQGLDESVGLVCASCSRYSVLKVGDAGPTRKAEPIVSTAFFGSRPEHGRNPDVVQQQACAPMQASGRTTGDSVAVCGHGLPSGSPALVPSTLGSLISSNMPAASSERLPLAPSAPMRSQPERAPSLAPAVASGSASSSWGLAALAAAAPPRPEVPSSFICPITMEIMDDPVFAADGHTYEKSAIASWLDSHSTSPLTNAVLDNRNLVPNFNLRSQIKEWVGQHPWSKKSE